MADGQNDPYALSLALDLERNGESLTYIKPHAGFQIRADYAPPPVGCSYLRMSGDPAPDVAYPGTTWQKLSGGAGSGKFQGTFPRFEGQYTGHELCTFESVQTSQNKSHGHTTVSALGTAYTYWGAAGGSNTICIAGWDGTFIVPITGAQTCDRGTNSNSGRYGGMYLYMGHGHTINADGGTEARPVNVGIQLYRRTA